ncbi:MAG: hypothetical protein II942_04155 [Alphaproteobacteria bacterium]|nr:hypothetical protein [Alphaproteobacteria bacterium]
MKKEYTIRPTDIKEYIGFQFQCLTETLEQFDYAGMAKIVRATHNLFDKTTPDIHQPVQPDCSLLDITKQKAD